MNGSVAIALPNGLCVDGVQSREASLRELSGEEQLFLAEQCDSLPLANWTTEVLARCLTRLGTRLAPDHAAIRQLTVGDRDALLLHLHELSFGQALQCEARCPAPGCGEKLELGLSVQELLLPAYLHGASSHELRLAAAGGLRVRFRLPTGEDQEAAVALALHDVSAGVAALVKRCVLAVEHANGTGAAPLPDTLEHDLSDRMAELDPQAELLLRADCPACGGSFRARFDIASFLRQRLAERAQAIYREIHLLAFHYHWSERDILGMCARKRQRYLRLLETALARGTLQ
jgi:hypothetical protein